mmetsp:Transcript_31377/g.78942  ORF Transcript_31377/g.78942 Transcript_31377/m.78942 type:complete len:322 (-) Transcript_31377:80-1045(-)
MLTTVSNPTPSTSGSAVQAHRGPPAAAHLQAAGSGRISRGLVFHGADGAPISGNSSDSAPGASVGALVPYKRPAEEQAVQQQPRHLLLSNGGDGDAGASQASGSKGPTSSLLSGATPKRAAGAAGIVGAGTNKSPKKHFGKQPILIETATIVAGTNTRYFLVVSNAYGKLNAIIKKLLPDRWITWTSGSGLMIPCASAMERECVLEVIYKVARDALLGTTVHTGVKAPWVKSHTGKVTVELIEEDGGDQYLVVEGDLYTSDGTTVFQENRLVGSAELFYGGREDRELIAVRGVMTSAIDLVVSDLRHKGIRVVSDTIPNLG